MKSTIHKLLGLILCSLGLHDWGPWEKLSFGYKIRHCKRAWICQGWEMEKRQ